MTPPPNAIKCGFCREVGKVNDVRDGREVVVTCPVCKGAGWWIPVRKDGK